MKKKISIAIDGPAGAGKSTVAKIIAMRLNYVYIDTGAMYRAFTLKALESGIARSDEMALIQLLHKTTIVLKMEAEGQKIYLDHRDVTDLIRSREITANVSVIAAHELIRQEMVKRQQKLAQVGGVVMDGRDIGTVVMPNADVKIFLDATVETRAERRHKENLERGIDSNLQMIQTEISTRDQYDTQRKVSPLRKAEDAILLDSSDLSITETVAAILEIVKDHKSC